ncbi:HEAT repeat domain-containing protein [Bacteroidota bacterium]
MKISKKIQSNIIRYLDDELNADECKDLEQKLAKNNMSLSEFKDLKDSLVREDKNIPPPSDNMNERFYNMIQKEESMNHIVEKSSRNIFLMLTQQSIFYKSAAAVIILLIGWAIGYYSMNSKNDILSNKINNLQEKIIYAMVDKPNASERLKAVEISEKMDLDNKDVVNSLFKTLNEDPNANVRFAALDLLVRNSDKPLIRVRLIQSIDNQNDPLLQYSIAQSMARLGATDAIPHLEKLLLKPNIVEPVRTVIADSIDILRNTQIS